MGFDPDQYLSDSAKGAFDPDAYLTKSSEPAEPATGAGQAALEHYGNAATLGYLPHIQALTEKLTPDPNADVDAKLKEQGFDIRQPDQSYLASRDANLKRLELEGQEHPVASAVGTGAGIAATALVPMGAAAKEAGLGAKMLAGAKSGAMLGAAANPGDKEGEIDPIQAGGRAKGATVGAAIGATIPAVVEGVATGANKVADYLRNKAALKATRALGRPTPTLATKMAKTGQDATLGRELLDQGAIPVLGTPGRISGRVDALREKAGQDIGSLLDKGGDAKLIDAQKIGTELLDHPDLAEARMTPGLESTASTIENQIETLAKNGEMSLKQAQKLRKGIDKSIKFNRANPAMSGAEPGLRLQRDAINDAINGAVNNLEGGASTDALKAANARYSNLSRADEILEREMGRNQANDAVSLKDLLSAAAMNGPAAVKVGAGALSKFGRTFGNSIQARVYDAISKKLPAVAGAAETAGTRPLVAQAIANRIGSKGFQPDDNPFLKDPGMMDMIIKDPSLIDNIQDEKMRGYALKALKANGRAPSSAGGNR